MKLGSIESKTIFGYVILEIGSLPKWNELLASCVGDPHGLVEENVGSAGLIGEITKPFGLDEEPRSIGLIGGRTEPTGLIRGRNGSVGLDKDVGSGSEAIRGDE